MAADPVDDLLERYLGLLDEYTTLRAQLNDLQRDVYQQLARANFAAERGMRYGQDYYDERMQAARRIHVDSSEAGPSVFSIVYQEDPQPEPKSQDAGEQPYGEASGQERADMDAGADAGATPREKVSSKTKDPLRWFGLLAPMPLRQAQSRAVQAIEEVIPRLVSVNAEMLQVEIEVRRARKKRAKTEAAEKQAEIPQGQKPEIEV